MGNVKRLVRKYAKQLLVKNSLRYSEMIIQRCLRSPAYIKCGLHICLCPIKYFAELVPIIDLFEVHHLNGRSGNYHTVEFFVLDIVIGFVELSICSLDTFFEIWLFTCSKSISS